MNKSLNNLQRQKNSDFTEVTDGYIGFETLSEIVSKYIEAADNGTKALIEGAEALVKDLRKLTKPMSEIRKNNYTHLVRTFTYEANSREVVVGWGKYYGRMVENGTNKMVARQHLKPVFERNKEKYYKIMLETLNIKTWK